MEIKRTLKLAKGEIKIARLNNTLNIEYGACNQNASTTNKILEDLLPIIDVKFGYKAKLSFTNLDTAIDDIKYYLNIKDTLIKLKSLSCHYGSDLITKLKEHLHRIPNKVMSGITECNLSYAEKLVLGQIEDVGCYELTEAALAEKYYDAKKVSLSPKFDTFVTEVNSFNYKKYDLDKTKVTKCFNEQVSSLRCSIVSFELLVKEHGDDLVNWGEHKLTRRGVNNWQARHFVRDYQKALRDRGVMPVDKKANDSVQKSRDNVAKTQEDYLRLFKNGTLHESNEVIKFLNLDSLKLIMTSPLKTIKDRVKKVNPDLITNAFCSLDDGHAFNIAFNFMKSNSDNTLPVNYLIKACDVGADIEKVRQCFQYTGEFMAIPDSFFDKILKPLPLSESLTMNRLATDAVMSRMSNEDVISVIWRMAGYQGAFALLGLEVATDKLNVQLDKRTVLPFDPSIYSEIKDLLFETDNIEDFEDMVVANKDIVMAEKMIAAHKGSYIKLASILSYRSRVKVIENEISKQQKNSWNRRTITMHTIFNAQEQKAVFKELLKLDNPDAIPYLTTQWDFISDAYFRNTYDIEEDTEVVQTKVSKSERNKLIAEYVQILESVKTPHAPIASNMPKSTRILLLKNGVTPNEFVTEDFTRTEFLSCLTLSDLKKFFPERLTEKELIEFAEEDAKFLKSHLQLFKKEYLANRFGDAEERKAFIGNRVHRENRYAHEKLTRILGT